MCCLIFKDRPVPWLESCRLYMCINLLCLNSIDEYDEDGDFLGNEKRIENKYITHLVTVNV